MSIDSLKERLPDFAKDVRLNLSTMLSDDTLGEQTKYGLLLACAIAARNPLVLAAIDSEAKARLSSEARDAALAAASIMAMNNVYYRFIHLASNTTYAKMPSKLRVNVLADHGVPKTDFELWCLAVSAINGCGICIDAHEKALLDSGMTTHLIQTAVRFAAIVQSVAIAIEATNLSIVAD